MNLFQMSILGSLLIIFITLLRRLLINKIPKMAFSLLWIIAALRLVMPFTITLPFNIITMPKIQGQTVNAALNLDNMPIFSVSDTPSVNTFISDSNGYINVFTILWLAGTLVFGVFFLTLFIYNTKKFKTSLPSETPYIKKWLTEHTCFRTIQVRVSDRISSPLTYGIFKPVILLPKGLDKSDTETLYIILQHEYIHICRFDSTTKLLFALALCMHWWNPLVWVMYILANRDMELSCDAGVIKEIGTENRSSYALALIGMEEKKNGYIPFESCFSKNAITERIEGIMKFKKASAAAIILTVILVFSSVFFFTDTSVSEQEALKELTESIQHSDSGTISFTIPKNYKNAENWNIHIAGVQGFDDGMSMSAHIFEDINESHGWEGGKVYTIETKDQHFKELNMDIYLPNNAKDSINLLDDGNYLHFRF